VWTFVSREVYLVQAWEFATDELFLAMTRLALLVFPTYIEDEAAGLVGGLSSDWSNRQVTLDGHAAVGIPSRPLLSDANRMMQ